MGMSHDVYLKNMSMIPALVQGLLKFFVGGGGGSGGIGSRSCCEQFFGLSHSIAISLKSTSLSIKLK